MELSVALDPRELRKLASELRSMADSINAISQDAAYELCANVGVPVARSKCSSPVVAGAIRAERTPRGAAVVCDHWRAAFEEFGTGIVGKLEGFPDPLDEEAAYDSDYQLDGMGHGWRGWRFPLAPGVFRYTWGRPGSGYMAAAARAMRKSGVNVGRMREDFNSHRAEKRAGQPGSVLP